MSKQLPHHKTDDGRWCRFSNVTVGDHAACPAGCSAANAPAESDEVAR
jgi:hypothetical protein